MLLNKVVVGKGYKMTVDSTTLTAPPTGYDSVSVIPQSSSTWSDSDGEVDLGRSRRQLELRRTRGVQQ